MTERLSTHDLADSPTSAVRRSGIRAALAVVVSGIFALGAPFAPAAGSTPLSDGLSFSDVSITTTLPQFSSDGQYAVYRQDTVTDGAFDLWSVRVDGSGSPVRLSDPLLATQGQFMTFAISPDGTRVVYAVDQDTTGKTELYSVPIEGGVVKKISLNFQSDRDVIGFRISPMSDRVVYYADASSWTEYALFSVPIDGPGGASVMLNPALSSDNDVDGFQISPGGETVIYRSGRNATGVWNIYSVPMIGGEAVRINQSLPATAAVDIYFRITPSSSRVLYLADSAVDGTYELFSVSIAGGGVTSLSAGAAAGYSVDSSFQITENGQRVVFRGATVAAQAYQLFSASLSGGGAVRLNGTLQTGEDVEAGFSLSASSGRVVYRSDEDINDIIELYSVPVTGSTPTRLNGALITGGDVLDQKVSPDGTLVVYRADQNVNSLNELFSVPIAGGPVTKLNRTLAPGGDVQSYRISPSGSWVVYGADQDTDTVDELLGVAITGGTVQNLSGDLVFDGDVVLCAPTCAASTSLPAFDLSPVNNDVLYVADERVNDEVELFVSSLGGPPSAPTAVVATPGNTVVSVTFAAPINNGGSPITGYTVTPSPASAGWVDSAAGSTALTHLVINLINGTAYTFTVRATNVNGIGAVSAPSNSATPATVPSAPTAVGAVPRNFAADVTFAASASNGGSAITGYTVISNPAGGVDITQGTTALKHYVSGLTNGIPYTFTVVAQNGAGQSPPSSPSSAVTPGCVPGVGANVFCDGVESSDTSNWDLTANPPGAPTGASATAGNATATVTFVAPTDPGGSPITGYTVTSNPAGGVDSNAGSTGLSHAITGLQNGTAYTFSVTASNAFGAGPGSLPSNSVTPATVPGAPGVPVAVGGDAVATVTLLPPVFDGGSPILGYTVVSDPPGGLDSDAGTTALVHTVTGLTNGTPYTFTVTATNSVGTGAQSKASNVVTPNP